MAAGAPIEVRKTMAGGLVVTTAVVRDAAGVYRWTSNNHTVPLDAAVEFAVDRLPGYDADRQRAAHDADSAAAIAAYRAARAERGYSREEIADMRDTFGRGARVVDAVTGQRIDL